MNISHLSSVQIADTMNILIYRMLEPTVLYSDLGYELTSSLLVMLSNRRRKITKLDSAECINELFYSFASEPEELFQTIKKGAYERSLLIHTVDRALSDDLPKLTCDSLPLRRHLGIVMRDYELFREQVYSRYANFVKSKSTRFTWAQTNKGIITESEEAQQNFSMAALRAMDKFNSNNGAMASYVSNWLKNAYSSNFSMNLGESYKITRTKRRAIAYGRSESNNKALGLEKADHLLEEEVPEENFDLLVLFSLLNQGRTPQKLRWAFLACHIPFKLTEEELKAQRATLLGENGND